MRTAEGEVDADASSCTDRVWSRRSRADPIFVLPTVLKEVPLNHPINPEKSMQRTRHSQQSEVYDAAE